MKIAHNPETGEYLAQNGDKWEKLTVAANDKGEKLYLSPNGWTPLDVGGVATPSNAPKPEQGGGYAHQFGVGTRGIVKGVLDTVAAPAAMVQNAAVNAFGRPDLQAGSVGDYVSDLVGLPQPKTAGERGAMRFNEGATSVIPAMFTGGAMGGAASPVTRGIGAMLQEAPALQAATGGASMAASGLAADSGYGLAGQIGAGLLAPMAVGGAASLAPGTRVNMARADAFKRAIGEVPSLGVVSDGGFAPLIEAAMSKYPVTAGTMRGAWDKSNTALRNSVEDAAGRVAGGSFPKTQNELGQAIIDGVEGAKNRQTSAYADAWNENLEPFVNADVPLKNTIDLFMQKAMRRTPEAAMEKAADSGGALAPQNYSAAAMEALGGANKILGGVWDDAINLDAASLGAVKDRRTVINEAIKDDRVASTMGINSADATRVSNALRDDIFSTLDSKAPDVANTLREMDGSYSEWIKKAERLDKRMTGAGREPEAVATKTEAGNLTLGDIIRLRDTLTKDEWAKIRGGIMNELPRSTQNETSAAAFATKTGKGKSAYRPEVQDAIWGNELNDALQISEGMNRVGANVNTSNTATQLQSMNMLTGGGTLGLAAGGMFPEAAALAASIYGIPYAAARFATSPKVTGAVTSPSYQQAIQSALGARAPMFARGLMSPAGE